MTPVNSAPHLSSSPPTLADIQRRSMELLAFHQHQRAQAARPPGKSLDAQDAYLEEDDPNLEEEDSSFAQDLKVLEQLIAQQDPKPSVKPAPPPALPPALSPAPTPPPAAPPPPSLAKTALYGLAGLVLSSLAPHTEADPAAILLQFLAAFGNLLGPEPHCIVGNTRHGLNLFVVLVGESSKARKGTSWRLISSLFAEVDPLWTSDRISTTRPTANSLVYALRDQEPVSDRRLFLLSEEFASVLHVLAQRSGPLSPLLRSAWDGGDLSAGSERRLLHAARPHLSMVGHITQGELAHHLSRTQAHNGFANRCLWTSVRRSRPLPNGGCLPPEQLTAVANELRRSLDWVQAQPGLCFRRSEAAEKLWSDRYSALSEGRTDAYGAATSRAEAQVLRLSALYAALDCSPVVDACHLQAALAVWAYCEQSAGLFFDGTPVDPTARRISQALTDSPGGLSKTQLGILFHGHVSSERIELALAELTSLGLVSSGTLPGRGRRSTVWAPVRNQKTPNLGA